MTDEKQSCSIGAPFSGQILSIKRDKEKIREGRAIYIYEIDKRPTLTDCLGDERVWNFDREFRVFGDVFFKNGKRFV